MNIRHLRVAQLFLFTFPAREILPLSVTAAIVRAGTDKTALRRALREARRSLDSDTQASAGQRLVARLVDLPEVNASKRLALYLPNDGEIDPSALIAWGHESGRVALLPVVRQRNQRNTLLFAPVTPHSTFSDNRFGIPEPLIDESLLVRPTELDLVLLPLVGFDTSGNRVGMGGGFYDTTFEFARNQPEVAPTMIGLAHEIQRVDRIEAESWDIPLDTIVTDRQIYRFNQI